eukprot:276892_1
MVDCMADGRKVVDRYVYTMNGGNDEESKNYFLVKLAASFEFKFCADCMANIMGMSTFCVTFVLLIHFCESYLSTLYTSSDEEYLSNVIRNSQNAQSGLFESSLSTTYYATQALSLSPSDTIPLADALCSTLKSHKISSWEEFHNLLLSRSRIPNCLDAIKDSSILKLDNGLSANKLSKVYFSINGIYTLSATQSPPLYDTSKLNLIDILTHIQSFQLKNKLFTEQLKSSKSKSSIHKTSMALYAIAKLLSLPTLTPQQKEELQSSEMQKLLKSFMSTANVLVKDYSKLDHNMISYSNSLTATSVVLESINEFLNSLRTINIEGSKALVGEFTKFNDKDYIESIIRYILTFRSTTSSTSARHVLVLMNMVKESVLFDASRPLAVRVSNQVFSDESGGKKDEKPLTVSITDIYGRQILAANDATSVAITAAKEKRIKKEGATGAFDRVDGRSYAFAFGRGVRELKIEDGPHGVYELKIQVQDDGLDKKLSIQTVVKVTTSIVKTVFGIQYTKNSDGYKRKTYPAQFTDVYDVSPSQKVKLEVQVKSVRKASQIVIEFVDSFGESVLQIVPKTRQEKYGITIDLNKASFGVLTEGRYSLNLIVGDELYGESLIWREIVSLNCIEEEDEAEEDYEPVNDERPQWRAKEEISHTFAEAEAEPIILFPIIFCVVVVAPLLAFVYYLVVSMAMSIHFDRDARLYSVIFIATLAAIVAILFLYWWQWNIFEAAGWLSMLCVPAFFFGYRVLKTHLAVRTARSKSNKGKRD